MKGIREDLPFFFFLFEDGTSRTRIRSSGNESGYISLPPVMNIKEAEDVSLKE